MKKKIITFIKFIILAAIFYVLLVLNIFHLGEKLLPITKDYIEKNITGEDQDLEQTYLERDTTTQAQTGHFAANDTVDLGSLCTDTILCEKIYFNGEFTNTEKYIYTKIISKIVRFIDENSNEDKQIEETIDKIDINKENGNRRGYATRDSIILNL